MRILKKTISLILVSCLLMGTLTSLFGCKKKTVIDNETTRLVLATTELDGVFNPFYSSSATDGTIVGMTQLGKLATVGTMLVLLELANLLEQLLGLLLLLSGHTR